MKEVKMFFINAKEQKIEEKIVPADGNTLKAMQECVEGYIEPAHRPDNNNQLYVNEEGLYQGYNYGFSFMGAVNPVFVGNGVVVGINDETGDTVDTTFTLDQLREMVVFRAKPKGQ